MRTHNPKPANNQLLPAPERSAQSALIGACFLLQNAPQTLAEADLHAEAFPDPLFHILYQLVCRLWQSQKTDILSEVINRDAFVETIMSVLKLADEHGPAAGRGHAQNLWRQIVHAGAHVHKDEFRTLLDYFEAYQSQQRAFGEARAALASVATAEQGTMSLGDLSSALRATGDSLARVSTRTTLGTSPQRWAELAEAMASPTNYLSTGFPDWDPMITSVGGFPWASLHVISAPTGSGKTAVNMGLLRNICFHGGCATCYVNYEVSAREFTELCCAAWTGVNPRLLRSGSEATQADQSRAQFLRAVQALSRQDLLDVVHQESFDLRGLIALISNRASRGYRFFIIDTVNRLFIEDGSRRDRFVELERCVQALEQAALRLDVVIVLAAQENREKSKRVDKVPVLSDIGGSSAIEQCAHSVAQLYRADLYTDRSFAELHINKSRGLGLRPKGTNIVPLRYEPGFLCYVPNTPAVDTSAGGDGTPANDAA